jgi:hypothetical protein
MEQGILTLIGWWLCGLLRHPLPRKQWIYDGYYHTDCRWCGRIISIPIAKGE